MAKITADRVQESSISVGVGVFALAGASIGYRPLSAVCAVNDTLDYAIVGVNPDNTLTGEWEVGVGTYSAANQLTRTTVQYSSNGGAAVNFSAGTKLVWLDINATSIIGLAPLASPAFTGVPTGPTAAPGTNTTQLATTAYVVAGFAKLSGANFTGELGVMVAAGTDAAISVGIPSGAAATLHGMKSDLTAPSTATSALFGVKQILRTAAAAFTLAVATFFSAAVLAKGAGSTITTIKGFEASNAIVNDTAASTTYGFWSDINKPASATGYQLYMGGTAFNYINGPVGVNVAPFADGTLLVGYPAGSVGTTIQLNNVQATMPSTCTSTAIGYTSQVSTAAAAFTLSTLIHFDANVTTRGAGSTISNLYMFRARNTVAVGTNNYAFHSDVNAVANTWQLYMGGSANSYFGGPVGILQNDALGNGSLLRVGGANTTPCTGSVVYGVEVDYVGPATATSQQHGVRSVLRTTNSAYSLSQLFHFCAFSVNKGAANTIGATYAFYVDTNSSVGTSNYAFWCNYASASGTWQLYMSGTAYCYLGGPLGVGVTDPLSSNPAVVNVAMTHPSSATSIFGVNSGVTLPSTATGTCAAYRAALTTAAVAFTNSDAALFLAHSLAKGAGSTITNAYGFFASLGFAGVATNTYGFYSNIAAAATTYQFRGTGTAMSRFDGPFGVLADPGAALILAGSLHPNTGTVIYSFYTAATAPSTATSKFTGFHTDLATAAVAFTLADMVHFDAFTATKGAGSTITNVRGHAARNAIAVGTNNYGFWSDINAGATTYQLYMGGTAKSVFGGPVYHAQDNSTTQAVSALYQGTGLPNNANGNNGDFYLRGDTPGTANQRLYVRSAGAWVGIV
jgi:hypothetical protein